MAKTPGPSHSILIPPAELERVRQLLDPKQFKQAMFQAVSRGTDAGVTGIRRLVRQVSYIDKKYVDRALYAAKPVGDPPVGKIVVSRKRIPMIAFKVSESKRGGVLLRTIKGKGIRSDRIKHAFIATVKARSKAGEIAEHQGVFLRRKVGADIGTVKGTKTNAEGYAWRLPIKQLYGPTVLGLVTFPGAFASVDADIKAAMLKRLDSQLDRFFKVPVK